MHEQHFNFDVPVRCESEAQTAALAQEFMDWLRAQPDDEPVVVALQGNLGAGKSFFARSMIRSLLPDARVKSPTYTLVEPYETDGMGIYHWDLYRLCDPEELEYMGVRDYFRPGTLHLVEWLEKGAEVIPKPRFQVTLTPCGEGCREIVISRLA